MTGKWVVVPVALLAAGACDVMDLAEPVTDDAQLAVSAPGSRTPYQIVGDCASGTLVDPGTVKVVGDVLTIRDRIVHCVLSGDFTGIVVLVENQTIHHPGTPQAAGRVFGTTELVFDSYFGDEDVDGTFVGAFNTSLQDILFGEFQNIRHGTGEFEGMVMHGVGVQGPPGVINETGEIFGR